MVFHMYIWRGAPWHTSIACASFCAIACMVAPFLRSRRCEFGLSEAAHSEFNLAFVASPRDYVWGRYLLKGAPPLGTFFASIIVFVAAAAVTVQRSERADRKCGMLRWVRRYVAALAMQAILAAALPWNYEVCERVLLTYGTLIVAMRFGNLLQMFILMKISLVRLQIIGDVDAARRGFRLLRCFALVAATTAGAVVLHIMSLGVVSEFAGLRLFEIVAGAGGFVCFTCLLLFHGNAAASFMTSCRMVRQECLQGSGKPSLGREAQAVFWFTVAAGASTLMTVASSFVHFVFRSSATNMAFELFLCVDTVSNASLALTCAGYLGPVRNMKVVLNDINELLEERRRRQILEILRAATGSGGSLAAIFAGEDEEALCNHAVAKFRCISWDVLKQHRYLVTEGHALDGQGQNTNDLYTLSMPCQLAHCDVFWSHSWHDDELLKWASLSEWCEEFVQEHGRAPRLWFDRVCIDQANVEEDLRCLPIFLAGCNNLLITAGPTYTTRLWCVTELFLYATMLGEDDFFRNEPIIRLLGNTPEERSSVHKTFQSVDIARCNCAFPADRERILEAITKHAGAAAAIETFASRVSKWLVEEDSLAFVEPGFRTWEPVVPSADHLAAPHGISTAVRDFDEQPSSEGRGLRIVTM